MTEKSPISPDELSADFPALDREDEEQLLPQLVAHLREHRTRLRQDWAGRISDAHLLEAMTPQEMAAEIAADSERWKSVANDIAPPKSQ